MHRNIFKTKVGADIIRPPARIAVFASVRPFRKCLLRGRIVMRPYGVGIQIKLSDLFGKENRGNGCGDGGKRRSRFPAAEWNAPDWTP